MSDKKKPAKPQIDSKEIEKLIEELTAALQRERADSMNLRRQHEDQLAKAQRLSTTKVIRALLPAVDNLERSLKHVPKDLAGHPYAKGVESVVKQFEKSLADLGVQRIKTVGEEFNPELHEAVHMDEGSSGSKEMVSEELQPGYTLAGEEVIRPAMVNVRLED